MNKKRIALITGINGQIGSYLADYLVSLNYDVHGIIRRHSEAESQDSRIAHLSGIVHTYYGDLLDISSLENIIKKVQPDEMYNLAAQSHVAIGAEIALYTTQCNILGLANLLEVYRKFSPRSKFLQSSSSEMFGFNVDPDGYQRETTRMDGVSIYGVSKIAGYQLTRFYRRAYNLHACNSICFNNESIPKNSPVIIKDENNLIDILPIEDMFRTDKHKYEGILDEYKGQLIWSGEKWTKIIKGDCYRDTNKPMKIVQTVGGSYEATYDHVAFDENNNEIETKNLSVGNKLRETNYPLSVDILRGDKDLYRFIGFMVAEGNIAEDGGIRITGCNKELLINMANLVCNKFGWTYKLYNSGPGKFENCIKDVWQLNIHNDSDFGKWLYKHIYTQRTLEKRIPKFILNANKEMCHSFFDGYWEGDARKAGNERYFYKGWASSSATLMLGLNLIFKKFSPNQIPKIKCDYRPNSGKSGGRYYYCQLTTDNLSDAKSWLRKDPREIIKIIDSRSDDGWFYDITTESQTFATGPNLIKIHNSPRRGLNFVTAKTVSGAVRIRLGLDDKLVLGNLNSSRDWSHTKDTVRAMHLIVNHNQPDDFVVSSMQTHSIKDMCKYVFNKLGMNYENYVKQDPKYKRVEELQYLRGDSTKARTILGWKSEYTFETLMDDMINHWMKYYQNQNQRFVGLDYGDLYPNLKGTN